MKVSRQERRLTVFVFAGNGLLVFDLNLDQEQDGENANMILPYWSEMIAREQGQEQMEMEVGKGNDIDVDVEVVVVMVLVLVVVL